MDKLIQELQNLLRELLAMQERLLRIAVGRQEAMRAFDVDRLNGLLAEERALSKVVEELKNRRLALVAQFRPLVGRGVEPTVSEIAKLTKEPATTVLLTLAAQLKAVTEKLDRNTRINITVSETVVKSISKVLKIVTGLAQHAGLYMRNGRKASVRGVHLLEVTA